LRSFAFGIFHVRDTPCPSLRADAWSPAGAGGGVLSKVEAVRTLEKGEGFWLWVVYCRESKHVIAWHISKSHLLKDAIAVLQKAIKQSQEVRPKKIITDGLWQYPVAIKKVIGWNWREQKKRHIISSGIGLNAVLERVNREIKRRYKWFGTFQAIKTANVFFNLFFYHFNKNGVNSTELT